MPSIFDVIFTFSLLLCYVYIGAVNFSSGYFSQGVGLISLSSVQCIGTETRLADCPLGVIAISCSHNKDAGVRCQRRTGI